MTIFLTILKIIGIVILAVLGLLLLFSLLILFAPVSYRFYWAYEEGKPSGQISIRWLFPILCFRASYCMKKKRIKLPFSRRQVQNEEISKAVVYICGIPFELGKEKEIKSKKASTKPVKEKTEEKKEEEKVLLLQERKEEAGSKENDSLQIIEPASKKTKKKKKRWRNPLVWLKEKFNEKKQQCYRMIKKIKAGINQIKEIFSLLCSEKYHGVRSRIKGYIKKGFSIIKPKKITGKIRFGFEDPYDTGRVTAVFGMLLPIYQDKLKVMPSFDEPVLEGEIKGKGSIQIIKLIMLGFTVWRDKKLRQYINKFSNIAGGL